MKYFAQMEAGKRSASASIPRFLVHDLMLGDQQALDLWKKFREMSIDNLKQVYQVNRAKLGEASRSHSRICIVVQYPF